MPKIAPLGGEVDWRPNEGTLGIVGVAPWATIDFCRALYHEVRAEKDWHYPRVLLDINTKLPSRGRHFQLGEPDPSPAIAETIKELHKQGATVVVVPCNTAHILYNRWSQGAPVPIPNIVHETMKLAVAHGAKRVTAFVSSSLSASGLYNSAATDHGLVDCPLAPEGNVLVSGLIETVKVHGGWDDDGKVCLDKLLSFLEAKRVDTVLLGCTELSMLAPDLRAQGFVSIDSNLALARAALAQLDLPPGRLK